jgi:hypothetical protein
MKRVVIYAVFLIVAVIIVVAAFAGTAPHTPYPLPPTSITYGKTSVVSCLVQYYTVYSVVMSSDSTSHGTVSTQSSNTSFTTTTSVSQTSGYVTSTEDNYTGTLTGALAEWTVSACTYT